MKKVIIVCDFCGREKSVVTGGMFEVSGVQSIIHVCARCAYKFCTIVFGAPSHKLGDSLIPDVKGPDSWACLMHFDTHE